MFDILDNGIVYFCGCAVFSFKNYIYIYILSFWYVSVINNF